MDDSKKNGTSSERDATQAAKERMAARLTKQVDAAPPTKNRSPDLIPLTAEYEQFKKKIRNLIGTAKNYAEKSKEMMASRDEVSVTTQSI